MKASILQNIILFLFFTQTLFAFEANFTNEEKNFLKKNPIISVANVGTYPPFNFSIKNKPVGYSIDYFKLLEKYSGIKFKFVNKKWIEHLSDLKNGSLDIIPHLVENNKRKEFADFTSFNHLEYFSGMTIRSDSPIDSIQDLFGKKVIVGNGTWLHKYLENKFPQIKLVTVPLLEGNIHLEKIESLEFSAYIGSIPTMKYLIRKSLIHNLKVKRIKGLGIPDKRNLPMAVKKGNKTLLSILEKINYLIPQRDIVYLHNKWFLSDSRNKLFLNKDEIEFIKNNPIIKVAMAKDYKPFSFKENGIGKGFDFDLLDLLEEKSGLKFERIQNSWTESLSNFKNKKVDLITGFTYNKEREEFSLFSPSYYQSNLLLNLFIRKDLPINRNITWSKNLAHKKIGIIKDVFFKKDIEKLGSFEIIEFHNKKELLLSLNSKEIDAIIFDISTIKNFSESNSYLEIKHYDDIEIPDIKKSDIRIGIQKDNTNLHNILKKTMDTIPSNKLSEFKKKWFHNKVENDLSLSLSEKLYLKNKKEIRFCSDPNWLPFEAISKKGEYKGIGSDLIKILSNRLDKKFVLVPTLSWAESLANIDNRKCDILPVSMNVESRRDSMNFTKAYTKEPFVIATKFDKIFIKDSLELANKKIGIVNSYAFSEVLKKKHKNINIVNVKNAKDGLERVRNGELFGYVDIVPAIVYTMQKYSMVDLKISGKLEFNIELSIASRNDEPELNEVLQKTLGTINEDKIRAIIGKWLSIKIEQKVDYTLLWQISFVFLLIIIIILYKNREVRKLNSKLLSASIEIKEQQFMVDKYVMIVTTDLNGKIVDVNEAFCKKIGYEKTELIGQSHKMMRHPNMTKKYFNDLWLTIKNNKTWSGEIQNLTKDNKNIYFNTVIEPLYKDMKKIGYRSISEDITDKKRIEELSITDKLTGLYNRLKIDEVLNNQIEYSKRYKVPFSVILIDIDNFKMINDTYGHDKGDYVLSEISTILKQNIRKTDSVGRWGGEEFFILCPNTEKEDCVLIAELIRKNVESHSFWDISKLTISLGLTSFLDNDNSLTIFKRVDTALYKAKNNGKNQTTVI